MYIKYIIKIYCTNIKLLILFAAKKLYTYVIIQNFLSQYNIIV